MLKKSAIFSSIIGILLFTTSAVVFAYNIEYARLKNNTFQSKPQRMLISLDGKNFYEQIDNGFNVSDIDTSWKSIGHLWVKNDTDIPRELYLYFDYGKCGKYDFISKFREKVILENGTEIESKLWPDDWFGEPIITTIQPGKTAKLELQYRTSEEIDEVNSFTFDLDAIGDPEGWNPPPPPTPC